MPTSVRGHRYIQEEPREEVDLKRKELVEVQIVFELEGHSRQRVFLLDNRPAVDGTVDFRARVFVQAAVQQEGMVVNSPVVALGRSFAAGAVVEEVSVQRIGEAPRICLRILLLMEGHSDGRRVAMRREEHTEHLGWRLAVVQLCSKKPAGLPKGARWQTSIRVTRQV